MDKWNSMTKFEGIAPERADTTLGFDTGYAYAIRGLSGREQTEEEEHATPQFS
jgi:hypothetical protein